MPDCYLVSEIAVECDAVGEQISSDISVCGIFTTDKLANDAVLTWHERDYVPVAAGDFDSYKLSKPEGLLHLVACAGLQSWEVSIEMIVMDTEFTMSLLDPSIPEDPIPDVTPDIRPKPKKRIKLESKDDDDANDDDTDRAGTAGLNGRRKKKTSLGNGSNGTGVARVKKEQTTALDKDRQVLKDKEAAVRRRKTLSSMPRGPLAEPVGKAGQRRVSVPLTTHNHSTSDPVLGEPVKLPVTSSSGITTLKYPPSSRPVVSTGEAPAKKDDSVTPMKRYLDQVLVPPEDGADAETKRKNELRRKKVEKELRQLQGWTSD
ncbi:protein of unknown function [Taphrina deformans PYCC 5710]|uniref:Uncharacterized protein n=1 Tax=Taphrina deformans (strain PYCC 5710 / ATCC 11124 / CBS 356.35 / IMI 108563 / JCM 9778 / NBRC 8474) TaxID=1097556 RepID=R4XMC3_TAPDE|nr:protein of unknown function [Taphrina deformans PYCC 5710]|eukprot:CCG84450.1 protein of unknown function [Taphrina deformans PYCC 5710]